MRLPWTARRSDQSVLKEINPEYSLEVLKLKLQYFDYLMGRADSLEKTLMLGKIEGGRRKGREGNGNPLQYSCLVGCSPWGLKEWNTTEQLHFHFSLSCVGEGYDNHFSILAWRILATGEPGGLLSTGLPRVGHD